jgi:parallel beta-helix repeat protein
MNQEIFEIRTEDFGEEHKTYVICKPGTYKLIENISFNPKKNKTSAISINSSNVILDLNGKVLKQSHRNKNTQITGIWVKSGHKNVTILGNYGVVKNFSQRGIYVEGGNDFVTLGDETLLTVIGNGYGTPVAWLDGQENILQAGIQLGDMTFLAWTGGLAYNGPLNNVRVNNVVSSHNNIGITLGEGRDFQFVNSSFSQNKETRLINPKYADPNLGAFYVTNSVVNYGLVFICNPDLPPKPGIPPAVGIKDILFENCKFNNNFADGSNAAAQGAYCDSFIMAVNFRNLKIRNCQFNNNDASFGSNNNGLFNQTRGCVLGSGYGTVIEDSEFNGNVGGFLVEGFNQSGLISSGSSTGTGINNFPGDSVILRNCVASNNVANKPVVGSPGATGQAFAAGFMIQYPAGFTLDSCIAESNIADLRAYPSDNPFLAFGFGAFIYSDRAYCDKFTNNVLIKNSKFSRNRIINANNFSTSAGIRVYDDLNENIVIENCVITDNKPAFNEPTSENVITEGISLFNQFADVKTGPSFVAVLNNVIQSNGTYGVSNNLDKTDIRNNEIKNQTFGVELSNSFYSTILDNTFLSNYIGIIDYNVPSTNLVAGNKGFNNTFAFYCQDNGVCTPGDVVVANGFLNAMPVTPTTTWYNTEVDVPEEYPAPSYQDCFVPGQRSQAKSVQSKSAPVDVERFKKIHGSRNKVRLHHKH